MIDTMVGPLLLSARKYMHAAANGSGWQHRCACMCMCARVRVCVHAEVLQPAQREASHSTGTRCEAALVSLCFAKIRRTASFLIHAVTARREGEECEQLHWRRRPSSQEQLSDRLDKDD